MNPPRTPSTPGLLTPGAPTYSAYAPAKGQRLPAVDDRLVAPESHAEILDGRVYRTMGANPPHATRHFEAAHLFAGVIADGYSGAVDMLTRANDDSDAAPDISVFPSAPDPVTGGRQLEEIAFEVLDTERMSHATEKVAKFAARGVRRLFAVRVAARKVYEWHHAHEDWEELDPTIELVDRCFRVPVPVAALIDRVLADDTVARSLLAARNKVIERELADREARGEARGGALATAAALLRVLARRGVPVDDARRARVLDCVDRATLDTWLDRAVTARTARDVFDD